MSGLYMCIGYRDTKKQNCIVEGEPERKAHALEWVEFGVNN